MTIKTPTTPLVLPIVHLNGTSRQELIEQRSIASIAIVQAIGALQGMSQNGRDYYPEPGLMEKAQAQHRRRLQTLKDLQDEIMSEADILFDEIVEKVAPPIRSQAG